MGDTANGKKFQQRVTTSALNGENTTALSGRKNTKHEDAALKQTALACLMAGSIVKLNQKPSLNHEFGRAFHKFKSQELDAVKDDELPFEAPRLVAFVLARGGSKGIPEKNIADLGGIPLIGYTIRTALHTRLFQRVIVSTDCKKIAGIAKYEGAEVPFMRPKDLAGDTALIGSAVNHALEELKQENYIPDAFACIYPTRPFNSPELIWETVAKLFSVSCSARVVKKISVRNQVLFAETGKGTLIPLRNLGEEIEEIDLYRPCGLCDAYRYSPRMNRLFFKRLVSFVESRDPVQWVDIDEPPDLERAREIVARGEFQVPSPFTAQYRG